MGTIFSRIKVNKKQVIAILILTVLSAIMVMLLPTVLGGMINNGVSAEKRSLIVILAIVMVGITVVNCIINFFITKISASISTKFGADLRQEVFNKVQTFSSQEIDKFGTASLITRSTSDILNVQRFLTLLLRVGIFAPLVAAAGLFFSATTGGEISSVLAIAIPLFFILCGGIVLWASKYSIMLREKIDNINKQFLENLEGVRVIRAFNKQKASSERFEVANADYNKTSIKVGRISALLMPAVNGIFGLTTAAILGLGAVYISQGAMDIGSLVANTEYITMVLVAVMVFSVIIAVFPNTYACAKRIKDVLNTEATIKDGDYDFNSRPLRSTVEFKNVTFAYPNAEEPLLKNISFKSNPGEITAIIGGTGCGKSSIIKLIPRLYDTLFGEILIDGVNIKDYKLNDLRSLIGYVPQKNILFSGDVGSNLNFGNANGTEKQWEEAARISCAEEFIEDKEDKYHSPISQGGTNLSGGQRQRMAIARAIMKKPEIYLFDDSFSALDMKTDRQLRENLFSNLDNSTVIIVAQRVSTIMNADRILVVDDGQIIDQGTHKELLKTCSLYQEICKLQLGEEAIQNA